MNVNISIVETLNFFNSSYQYNTTTALTSIINVLNSSLSSINASVPANSTILVNLAKLAATGII